MSAAALRVVVVDDDHDVADSLAMVLELLGAEVKVAYDGLSGVAAVAGFRPTIAFLDLGMAGMDGFETARRVRQMPEGRRVKLVALTGWGRDEDRARTREAGFDLHITKPASIEALEELLRQAEAA